MAVLFGVNRYTFIFDTKRTTIRRRQCGDEDGSSLALGTVGRRAAGRRMRMRRWSGDERASPWQPAAARQVGARVDGGNSSARTRTSGSHAHREPLRWDDAQPRRNGSCSRGVRLQTGGPVRSHSTRTLHVLL